MKERTKQLQSSGETRKTNRPWHFLSTLNSLLLSKLLLLLIIPVIGTTSAFGDTVEFVVGTDFGSNTSSGVTKGSVTLKTLSTQSSNTVTGSDQYIYNDGTAKKEKCIQLAQSAGNDPSSKCIEVSVPAGYKITGLTVRGAINSSTSTGTYPAFCWAGAYSAETGAVTGTGSLAFPNYNGTSDGANVAMTGIVDGTRTIRIYKQVKYSSATKTIGNVTGASAIPSSNPQAVNIAKITVTYTATGGTTYSVTYDGNSQTSGTAPTDDNNYLSGSTVTVLGNTGSLTKTDYTFAGWNTAAGGTGTHYNAGETFSIGSADVDLYAVYKHLVTIGVNDEAMGTVSAKYAEADAYYGKEANDAFVSGSFVSHDVDITLTATPNPGYEFDPYANPTDGGKYNPWGTATTKQDNPLTNYNVSKNQTLTAHFKAKTYAITLDKNGGNVSGSTTATYNSSALADYSAATRSGYVLTGYYTETSGGTKVIDAEGNLVASATGYTDGNAKWIKTDVATPTLYAQWERVYTVTFDATTNEGTCATASLTQAAKDASITLPNASKEGNTFKGWFTTASGDVSAGIGGATYTPEDDVTLYAQFTPIASGPKFHFVSKTSTDNINGTVNVTTSDYAETLDGGTLTYFSDGSRDYKYGLKLGSNAGYLKIELSKALAIGDKITFDQGTGSNQISFTKTATRATTPATNENTYTITSTDGLAGSKTLYVWRATGSTTYVKELTITSTGAAATYAISYDLAGLADEMDDMADQETLPNPLPTPENVMEGYTFEGWYTNSTFTTRATAGATLGANTTLYANYIIDTPTITPASGAVYANTTMTLSSNVPFTKTYIHWKTTGDAETKSYLETCGDYNGEAIDTYSGFTMPLTAGTQYCSYMISDGTFYSVPAITSAYTVSHLITIGTQPVSAMYVQGDTPTALSVAATVTGSGTLSYLWESSGDGETWNNASGTNNAASYTPSTATTGTTYYRCTVSSNNGAANVTSNAVTVTVNAAAAFTVSFNTGVGSNDDIDDIAQATSGASITLPSVTVSSSDDYEFAGWYDGDTNKGLAGASYTPAGNITLTAKYKCKVTFDKIGDGSVSAVNASTGAAISSGSKVLEGTEITITATPTSVNEFESWSGDASGSTNPITIEISDVTSVTANFSVSEYAELFHTTFTTSDGWASGSENVLEGTTVISNEKTINGTKVTFVGSTKGYTLTVNTDNNKLTYGGNNMNAGEGSSNPTCHMAIHLTGVNGSITVDFGSASQKWLYALDDGNTGAITTARTTIDPKATSFTLDNLQSSNVILYLGNAGVSLNEITITTPKTRLVADSAQVRFIGTAGGAVPVRISTNSPGAISVKTNPNGSYATVIYNASTKILTVTPVAAGETSVVMQVAQSGSFPAKELTIPIKVINPAITIKTQPTNLTCYQNEATEKKFTVVATVNTGNELTYQWYSCTAADKTGESPISGAISSTYILNTAQKATVGTKYYFCRVTCAANSLTKDTEVKTVTVSAIEAGGTYSTVVYAVAPGNSVEFDGMTGYSVTSGASTDNFTAAIAGDKLTITGKTTTGSGTVVVTKDEVNTTINVTVNNHTVQLIWSAESKEYNVASWKTGDAFVLDDGSNNGLPILTRLYEDGTAYTKAVTFYVDDPTMAYFGTAGTNSFYQDIPSNKPSIKYGGGQGGCKFYAYIAGQTGIEPVKASYDLRMVQGYSNAIPEGRKVEVQQQYTLWKDATEKLVTVTYGGYKYKNGTWGGKTDAWGSATNYVGKDNAIDGFLYAVRNKERDATDEYEHAIHQEDDFGSAWYKTTDVGNPGGVTRDYQRIKPFRLPCRASYLTFTAHESGTLTAYVYQNGIIGRGNNANQLASGPRLGYWFDEEGWVQQPVGTVVTKQKIANANARDKRPYGGYDDMEAQMNAYWTNTDDAIVKTMLLSKWCDNATNPTKYSTTQGGDGCSALNPYYWGNTTEVTNNNNQVVPTPERPIPHQGGHMIVNEGYVKYTINVVAGKTYYFFGKMTKVGYAGMTFVPAASENRETERVDLATDDNWTTEFGASGSALKNTETTIYDEITVPSNYRIGKWNTICLPFAVNENQLEEVFGKGTELAIFNGLRHDEVNHVYYIKYLRHVDQNILPGQPYLIYPTGRAVAERSNQDNGGMAETGENVPTVGTTDKVIGTTIAGSTRLTFRNVIINKGVTAKSYGCDVDADGSTTSYVFTGTDQQKQIAKYDLYNAPKTGALNRYMPSDPSTKMTLNTYHAFIQANDSQIMQDAITFAFSEDDIEKAWDPTTWRDEDEVDPGEATGIVIIEDVTDGGNYSYAGRAANGKTYNLMGQEVDARSAKGIVISNGKKVMY